MRCWCLEAYNTLCVCNHRGGVQRRRKKTRSGVLVVLDGRKQEQSRRHGRWSILRTRRPGRARTKKAGIMATIWFEGDARRELRRGPMQCGRVEVYKKSYVCKHREGVQRGKENGTRRTKGSSRTTASSSHRGRWSMEANAAGILVTIWFECHRAHAKS